MEYRQCSKGHFYDPAVSSTCPQCAAEAQTFSFQGDGAYPPTMPVNMSEGGMTADMEDYSPTEPVYVPGGSMEGNAQKTNGSMSGTVPQVNRNGMETQDVRGDSQIEDYEPTMPVVVDGMVGFAPVVGWLVCVEGPARGTDYRICSGNNYIGRAEHMDICIKGDRTIGRERHAMITYDMIERLFFFAPIAGKSIVRVNGKLVMVPTEIHAFDMLQIGATKLVFVPLCGERFNWDE